jgi:hypothetical protein
MLDKNFGRRRKVTKDRSLRHDGAARTLRFPSQKYYFVLTQFIVRKYPLGYLII